MNFSHVHSGLQGTTLASFHIMLDQTLSPCVSGTDLSLSCQSSPVLRRASYLTWWPRSAAPEKRVPWEGSTEGWQPGHCSSPSQAVSCCQHEVPTHEETPTEQNVLWSLYLKMRHVGTGVRLGLMAPDDFP